MTKQESVTVAGTGVVSASPDVLRLEMGVEAHDVTVDGALVQANGAMSAVQRSLMDSGVRDRDLRTSNLAIRTEYDRQGRVVSGFVVNQGLEVWLRDVSRAGDQISAAASAGGDRVRINGLTFGVDDDAALMDQARRTAVDDARSRAQTLADAAGRRVGRALRISEGSPTGPGPGRARMMAAESASVPVQGGMHEISVTVAVEWALE